LTALDQVGGDGDRTIVLCFGGAPLDPERLKKALEVTLGKYPVLAGVLRRHAGKLCFIITA
jgi:hypothetical protein